NSCPNLRQVRNLRSGENWEGAGQETLTSGVTARIPTDPIVSMSSANGAAAVHLSLAAVCANWNILRARQFVDQ
ncbi:hypothetical protein, partial [Profundibacterium mesophilum]|uniref:hypothetical protein n=1 Tax=Profundibacterium mesophilum TaxID=1258573 RepID=UPI001F2CA904